MKTKPFSHRLSLRSAAALLFLLPGVVSAHSGHVHAPGQDVAASDWLHYLPGSGLITAILLAMLGLFFAGRALHACRNKR